MCKGVNAEYLKAECRAPEQEMWFIEVIKFPVNKACIIIMLQHIQRNIGVMGRIFIHQGKQQRTRINQQAKETYQVLGEIFLFEAEAVMFQVKIFKDPPGR